MSTTTTLTLARNILGQFARSAGDATTYPDAYKDRAIRSVCDDLIRHTSVSEATSDVALVAGDHELDLSGLATFNADRVIGFYLTHPTDESKEYDVDVVGAPEVRTKRRDCLRTAPPCKLAILNDTTGILWPTPDLAYDGHLAWRAPLTPFTIGTQGTYSASVAYYPQDVVVSSGTLYRAIAAGTNKAPASNAAYWTSLGAGSLTGPDSVTLNIRDDYLETALMLGGTAIMQHTDPAALYASDSYQRYVAFRTEIKGRAGSKSAKSVQRG